jgi:hypothetical protein
MLGYKDEPREGADPVKAVRGWRNGGLVLIQHRC